MSSRSIRKRRRALDEGSLVGRPVAPTQHRLEERDGADHRARALVGAQVGVAVAVEAAVGHLVARRTTARSTAARDRRRRRTPRAPGGCCRARSGTRCRDADRRPPGSRRGWIGKILTRQGVRGPRPSSPPRARESAAPRRARGAAACATTASATSASRCRRRGCAARRRSRGTRRSRRSRARSPAGARPSGRGPRRGVFVSRSSSYLSVRGRAAARSRVDQPGARQAIEHR